MADQTKPGSEVDFDALADRVYSQPTAGAAREAFRAALAAAERRAEEAESRLVVGGMRLLVRRPCLLHAGEHTAEECAALSRAASLSARVEALEGALRAMATRGMSVCPLCARKVGSNWRDEFRESHAAGCALAPAATHSSKNGE